VLQQALEAGIQRLQSALLTFPEAARGTATFPDAVVQIALMTLAPSEYTKGKHSGPKCLNLN